MAEINAQSRRIIKRIEKATLSPKLNKKAVEAAFRKQYKLLGVDFPKEVIWKEDLLLGFECSADAAWGAAWGAARDAARGAAWVAAWGAARDAAWDAAWGAARGAAWGAARDAAWGAARDAARGAACGAARDAARDAARGAAWVAAWGAARDAAWGAAAVNTGLKDPKTLRWISISTQELKALENGLAWFFPMNDKLILVPLPKFSFDEQNRLHSDTKPAIDWKREAKFYFIHGVKVTEKIVLHPEKLTKKDWINEKNMEVKRVIQDRMPNFVKKIGGKSTQKDKFGELISVDLGSDPEKTALYVKLKDSSTSRVYYLRVPPTIKTAQEAVGWSFGLNDYNPQEET